MLLEKEKNSYYFAFDTKEITRGSQEERYKAYETALKNNFLQIDEVRALEDYQPLGFNYIKLGLQDVLLNPKTNEIYTPNTGQSANIEDGMVAKMSASGKMEDRANSNRDKSSGKYTFAPVRMGVKEHKRLSHQIFTDFPSLPVGEKIYNYSNRNHFYQFSVEGYGSYNFYSKLAIDRNRKIIDKIMNEGGTNL